MQPNKKFTDDLHQPANGEMVYEKLLDFIQTSPRAEAIKEKLNAADIHSGKRRLFEFFLHEMAHEMAAATYTSGVSDHETIDRLSFNDLAKAFLESKNLNEESLKKLSNDERLKLYEEFTAQIKTVHPRVLEQTPHPTEPLDTKAINSYMALRDFARKEVRPLFEQQDYDLNKSNLPVENLVTRIGKFFDDLEPPESNLSAEKEQARSASMSKSIYDSVPALASNLLKTRDLFGLKHIENEVERQGIAEQMREMALDAGEYMVRNYTWSPMDMDGKLQMDRRAAEAGLKGKKLAINQQYIEDLAGLGARLQEAGQEEAAERVRGIIWRLFGNIEKIYPTVTVQQEIEVEDPNDPGNMVKETVDWPAREQEYFNKIGRFLEDVSTRQDGKTTAFIQDIWAKRHDYDNDTRRYLNIIKYNSRDRFGWEGLQDPPEEAKRVIADLKKHREIAEAGLKKLQEEASLLGYVDRPGNLIQPEETVAELQKIAAIEGVRDIKYLNSAGQDDAALSDIDAITLKVATYKNSAQKISWRQSSDVHEQVMAEVLSFVTGKNSKKTDSPSVLNRDRQDFGFMKRIQGLVDSGDLTLEYSENGDLDVRDLIRIMKEKENTEVIALATDIRHAIRAQVKLGKDEAYAKKDVLADPNMTNEHRKAHFEKHKTEIYTFETLDVADFVNQNGKDFGHLLTAETDGPEPLWNVFAEQLIMQDPAVEPPNPAEQPQIIALTEYLDDIINLPKNLGEAMAFKPFKEEMKARAEKGAPWLQLWDEKEGGLRKMQTRDLLDQMDDEHIDQETGMTARGAMLKTMKARLYLLKQGEAGITPENLAKVTDKQLKLFDTDQEYQTLLTNALNEDVVSYVAMVAGSDSFKSAGAAIEYTIDRRFQDAQKQLMAYDTLLNYYMGNGSAMHRVGITNALIRTHQGRQMKEGVETLTAESMNIVSQAAARKMGLEGFSIGKPKNDVERFIVAIHNIGNRANLPMRLNPDEQQEYDDLCYESEAFYSSIYKDYDKDGAERPAAIVAAKERIKEMLPKDITPEDFGHYMQDVSPRKLDVVSKNGARYAFRPGVEDAFVDSMRAIGYGAAHGYTGFGQPHLTFALSHMLDSKHGDPFTQYVNNPYLQGRVNRAVKDLLVEFNPETGWKNVASGCGLSAIEHKRSNDYPYEVSIRLNGSRFTLEQLVEGKQETIEALSESIAESQNPKSKKQMMKEMLKEANFTEEELAQKSDEEIREIYQEEITERTIKNIRMAAVMELEGRKAITATTKLFKQFQEKCCEQDPGKQKLFKSDVLKGREDDPLVLLEYYKAISPTKGYEMEFLRNKYQPCLENASEYFKSSHLQGGNDLPKKVSQKHEGYDQYRDAYYDISTMKTILETPLTSDKSPAYAVALANDNVKGAQIGR